MTLQVKIPMQMDQKYGGQTLEGKMKTSDSIAAALKRVGEKISQLKIAELGYPLSENVVRPSSIISENVPRVSDDLLNYPTLRHFYELCDGISLPDVGNGIFIHTRLQIATAKKRKLPRYLRSGEEILVFGTDGGGGMFAVFAQGKSDVIHLSGGAVVEETFDNVRTPQAVVTADFIQFLYRVADDIDATARGLKGWRFIA